LLKRHVPQQQNNIEKSKKAFDSPIGGTGAFGFLFRVAETGGEVDPVKKQTILLSLLFLIFVSFGHLKEVHAEMPVPCNAINASTYPEYYTTCIQGATGTTNIPSSTYYVSYLDQYRMDYGSVTGSTNYSLHFVAANGTVYNADYDFSPTGTHYLTCNGRYSLLFYDSSHTLISSTSEFVTTAIVNPTCSSYADGATGKDDLSGSMKDGKITWQPKPDAVNYEIYKDGVKVGETTGTEYTPTSDGSYSVVAKDSTGAIVGQTDINVKTDTTPPAACDECKKLSELLACPDWDTYMGELTKAVKAAIPPPPNWDDVANKIGTSVINKFSDYVGEVPAIPTVNDINQTIQEPALPTIDNSSQKALDLVPTVPSDFDQPLNNDLNSAPVIPIEDKSKPFSLTDPLSNITYDDPNVPVFPQDPRNNSGGIDAPTTINEPAPTPKAPVSDPSSPPIENAPHVEIPTPSANNGSGGAVPSNSASEIPIPSLIP
jgi:hypothetical protein